MNNKHQKTECEEPYLFQEPGCGAVKRNIMKKRQEKLNEKGNGIGIGQKTGRYHIVKVWSDKGAHNRRTNREYK